MTDMGAFAVVLDANNRMLFMRRNYGKKNWSLPGGKVEVGESPFDAAVRETLEETGYIVETESLVNVTYNPKKDNVVITMRCRLLGGEPIQPNDEVAEIAFFGKDELPSNLSEGAKLRVADGFAGVIGGTHVIG